MVKFKIFILIRKQFDYTMQHAICLIIRKRNLPKNPATKPPVLDMEKTRPFTPPSGVVTTGSGTFGGLRGISKLTLQGHRRKITTTASTTPILYPSLRKDSSLITPTFPHYSPHTRAKDPPPSHQIKTVFLILDYDL